MTVRNTRIIQTLTCEQRVPSLATPRFARARYLSKSDIWEAGDGLQAPRPLTSPGRFLVILAPARTWGQHSDSGTPALISDFGRVPGV